MSPSISIIIPVYNAGLTLEETLKSIESEIESNPELELEIIAVDDGSTDNSLEILNKWASRIPLRIEKLTHSGSPAGPRNRGIQVAQGDYLFFLDADDVLLPNGLSSALGFAEIHKSDVVVCRLKSLDGRGAPRGMHSENFGIVRLENSRIYWSLNPMKLFKRELISNNGILFESGLGRDEDQPFVFQAYLHANNISVLSNPPVVGIRYTPTGSNLTLRAYPIEDLMRYLDKMSWLLRKVSDVGARKFLAIRHWEIEISREMFWKRLHTNPAGDLGELLGYLQKFASEFYDPASLPKTSIRWRSIVRLIAANNIAELERLVSARSQAISGKNVIVRCLGALRANVIRARYTFMN